MESVGFKEWALVCEALGRGEQTIILRKGGIAEGRDGFAFKHREFFLFPTLFHEQVEKTRLVEAMLPEPREGEIAIEFFAKLEFSAVVTSWEMASALEPFHVLRTEVVRERFEYKEAPGIHVAFVRVFRLSTPWILSELPAYGGCRSWVNLPVLREAIGRKAVLGDAEHQDRTERVKKILGLVGVE